MQQPPNRNEPFRASTLLRDAQRCDVIKPGLRLRIARPLDAESLVGRHEGSRRPLSFGSGSSLSAQLQKRLGSSRALATALRRKSAKRSPFACDPRQRAVVKLHYFGHAKGGAVALKKHVKYLARDDAAKAPDLALTVEQGDDATPAEERAAKKVRSAERPEHWIFYDETRDSVSGARLAEEWGKADRRHFRLILSPENGGRIGDLRAYARDVMARAEAALGDKLQWFAVDHWDTDNPHTHIVLRGRRSDGRDLILPRDFIQHGFRNAARDAATDRLGPRTRNDARRALEHEAIAHRPTRLDALIEGQLDKSRQVRIAELAAPNGSPDMTDALKARARELKNLGLAREVRRNVLQFEPGWRDALKAMELHLDIRKSLMQARAQNASRAISVPSRGVQKDGRFPFGFGF